MQIVQVDESNVGYAVGLGQELVSKSSFGTTGPEFDWQYALASTRQSASAPSYFIRLAQHTDGSYTGFVGGHLSTFFFNPAIFAIEDAWYVREGSPDRTKAAVMLMRAFVDWAMVEKKAVLVQSGDVAGINSIAVDTMYRRLGFKRWGSIYKYTKEGAE